MGRAYYPILKKEEDNARKSCSKVEGAATSALSPLFNRICVCICTQKALYHVVGSFARIA